MARFGHAATTTRRRRTNAPAIQTAGQAGLTAAEKAVATPSPGESRYGVPHGLLGEELNSSGKRP